MNQRGQYGQRALVGAEVPSAPSAPNEGSGFLTMLAVAAGGLTIAVLATRSMRAAYRRHDREIYSINRAHAMV
jgi:hypothetical protein